MRKLRLLVTLAVGIGLAACARLPPSVASISPVGEGHDDHSHSY